MFSIIAFHSFVNAFAHSKVATVNDAPPELPRRMPYLKSRCFTAPGPCQRTANTTVEHLFQEKWENIGKLFGVMKS